MAAIMVTEEAIQDRAFELTRTKTMVTDGHFEASVGALRDESINAELAVLRSLKDKLTVERGW